MTCRRSTADVMEDLFGFCERCGLVAGTVHCRAGQSNSEFIGAELRGDLR
jgi:hypothetical protein